MVVYRVLTDFLLIHLFLGPKPKEVMKQLTSVVGRLQKPPSKLALGYFVCRQSGSSPEDDDDDASSLLKNDLLNMDSNNIPYDGDCISHDLLSTGSLIRVFGIQNEPSLKDHYFTYTIHIKILSTEFFFCQFGNIKYSTYALVFILSTWSFWLLYWIFLPTTQTICVSTAFQMSTKVGSSQFKTDYRMLTSDYHKKFFLVQPPHIGLNLNNSILSGGVFLKDDNTGQNWKASYNQKNVVLPDFQETDKMPLWWNTR